MGIRKKAERLAEYLERGQPDRPEEMAELLPLWELAQALRTLRRPELRPEALATGLVRVREKMTGRPPIRRHRAWRVVRALAAFLLALILGTAGLTLAAEGSLPGEALYPIKRGNEQLRLALATSPDARCVLLLAFAERRLDEVAAVCSPSGCPDDLLADLGNQTEEAADAIERLPEEKQGEFLEQLVDLTTRQQEVLYTLLEQAPETARPGLERALERSRRGQERARQKQKHHGPKSPPPGNGPRHTPAPKHSPGSSLDLTKERICGILITPKTLPAAPLVRQHCPRVNPVPG